MVRCRRWLPVAFAVAVAVTAAAAPAAPLPGPGADPVRSAESRALERERIARERADADGRLAVRERECRVRFVVASCLEEARAARRETLSRLRQQEIALDETDRRERAAARRGRVQRAGRGEAPRGAAAVDQPPPRDEAARPESAQRPPAAVVPPAAADDAVHPSAPRASRPGVRAAAPAAVRPPRTAPPPVDRREEEARSREAYERKQREAEAHRQALQRREAERAASGKPAAAPLPDPTASPAR